MSSYLVANVTWNDMDALKKYGELVIESLRPFGGRYLARGAVHSTVEGDKQPARLAIVEFPSIDAAKIWVASKEYKPALEIRQRAATTHWIVLMEGLSK
jgi:uncharacterized protein (DUF1330 family)